MVLFDDLVKKVLIGFAVVGGIGGIVVYGAVNGKNGDVGVPIYLTEKNKEEIKKREENLPEIDLGKYIKDGKLVDGVGFGRDLCEIFSREGKLGVINKMLSGSSEERECLFEKSMKTLESEESKAFMEYTLKKLTSPKGKETKTDK